MKVLNLLCSNQHGFEGWFGSEAAFQSQLSGGLVECPLCGDKQILKMPSAPRLNLGGQVASGAGEAQKAERAGQGRTTATDLPLPQGKNSGNASTKVWADGSASMVDRDNQQVQAALLKALRQFVSHSEDVGSRFAEEARRMHYGEAEGRSIRGQTSMREAVELIEEGIDVVPLPMAAALKETLQ